MTTPPKIYVEVSITYGEIMDALEKLGYQKEFDGRNNVFTNEKYQSKVVLQDNPRDAIVERIHVAMYSHRLYLQGVIKQEEELIHRIQKARLKKNKAIVSAQ